MRSMIIRPTEEPWRPGRKSYADLWVRRPTHGSRYVPLLARVAGARRIVRVSRRYAIRHSRAICGGASPSIDKAVDKADGSTIKFSMDSRLSVSERRRVSDVDRKRVAGIDERKVHRRDAGRRRRGRFPSLG